MISYVLFYNCFFFLASIPILVEVFSDLIENGLTYLNE